MNTCFRRSLPVALILLTVVLAPAQTAAPPAANGAPRSGRAGIVGTVRGTVKDDTGGIIPGATVTLLDASGKMTKTTTGGDGTYVFRGVPPGTYSLSTTFSGLQQSKPLAIEVKAGQSTTGDVVMTLATQKQELTVTDSGEGQVSTEAANNASVLVLNQEDLDALPDDPDDLNADLQALAGPAAGPGGTQIFIDGFTGGQLPPKASIREIRINSNPFSAEYDKLGFGRIEIFTKPGTDKFHGQGYYNISDGIWNARNPFLPTAPPFRTQIFGGNVSGPITKKASFFVDVERRNIDDNGIITASIPTANFLGYQSYQNYFPTPQRRTTVSPRIDYALTPNNTLSMRYNYLLNDHILTNIGPFPLPTTTVGPITYQSNGYGQSTTDNTFQAVDTAVLGPHVINETRFEYERTAENTNSVSTGPELNVGQAFIAGGSGYSSVSNAVNSKGYPNSFDTENYYELQNYTTVTAGAHTIKFGARIRSSRIEDLTPLDFNGTYSFLGTGAGNGNQLSIEQYLMTEQLFARGYSPAAITSMGYGPSRFQIQQGNPLVQFWQTDWGPFVQDEWRVRPNFTLSLGLRYEGQTNINDHADFAPRLGFAWAPGNRGGKGPAKTVFRGGWGFFYDRFAATNVQTAIRSTQVEQYTVDHPTAYDATFSAAAIPVLSELTETSQQHYIIDSNLHAPRLMQTVLGMDRQLAAHTRMSVNFINSRGVHELLTNDINAPVPTFGELPPGINDTVSGIRPYGNIGDIYDYQSVGIFKEIQASVNMNSQIGKWFTIFGRYQYAQAHSDTDGIGTVPSNPYNISQDWGRASLDIHHTVFMGGSLTTKYGLRFSPFMVIRSGIPFNVTTGTDLYATGSIAPTARPEVSATDFAGGIFQQRLGLFYNPDPLVGAPVIGRNYGTGPGFIGLNLRVSKTFGFGTTKFEGPSGGARSRSGAFGGGGRGGGGGPFGNESTTHRYNLTLSVMARNILNHENLNTPNGAITSPYFYQSTGITGGFGAESTSADQRRVELQLRFAF
jgi:hypothetical protein